MKRILKALLFFVLTGSVFGQTNWYQGTLEEAFKKGKASDKLVLMFFYSGG